MTEINPEIVIEQAEIVIGYDTDSRAEILQNVRIICNTAKGSVPLDREFGVDWNLIDQPTPRARTVLVAEIFEVVEKYEPRARVTRVDWDQLPDEEMDGQMKPRVQVELLAND